jgi:transposase InsO family protein
MIALEDRQIIAQHIEQAHRDGARVKAACALAGIDARTLQRWRSGAGLQCGDTRPQAVRPMPTPALSAQERAQILSVANEPRFAELPPARIVPMLADEGVYIASESSFNRVLRAHRQSSHRGRVKAPQRRRPPTTHIATAPRQVWCWDMTFLPAAVLGRWFYLILDLYSRKIVGWEAHESDSSDYAVDLLRRTALAEGLHALAHKPVLHGDNGSTLKATTVLAMLQWLGLKSSYSRPRVSHDNAFVEALFRTAKYRPQFRAKGFADLQNAREWASSLVQWYNHDPVTAPFATSARRSDMLDAITTSWRPGTLRTSDPRPSNHVDGRGTHATGIRSPSSRSIPNAIRSSSPRLAAFTILGPSHEPGDNYLDMYRFVATALNVVTTYQKYGKETWLKRDHGVAAILASREKSA